MLAAKKEKGSQTSLTFSPFPSILQVNFSRALLAVAKKQILSIGINWPDMPFKKGKINLGFFLYIWDRR